MIHSQQDFAAPKKADNKTKRSTPITFLWRGGGRRKLTPWLGTANSRIIIEAVRYGRIPQMS
jgi:hypothetical protein